MGRFVDRRGLRPMLILTTIAEVVFWTTAQAAPYWLLLVTATVGGFLSLPAFSVARQSIAALTPEAQRLPAFALDSMTTELSFMAGPALGVLIATAAGPRVAMAAIGAGLLLAGIGLYVLNPPVRAKDEGPVSAGDRVPRSSWLKPRLVAVLTVSMAATLVLSGTDVAVVAVLRNAGELSWTGLVLSLWAVYSLLGGFLYGTIKRGLAPVLLLAPMAVLTIPVGLGGGHWWLLAILLLPAGALCAPTITASADAVSRMTPGSARGEAMGLHNSALTVGVATGSPVAGLVMDIWSPAWGFAAVGGLGVLVTLVVLPVERRRRRTDAASDAAAEAEANAKDEAEPTAGAAAEAEIAAEPEATGGAKAGEWVAAGRRSAADSLGTGAAGSAVEAPH
jgi:predicted MFS family arabinose efflux permease